MVREHCMVFLTTPHLPPALQGHSYMRKYAWGLELLLIVQSHLEQQDAGQTLQSISLSEQTVPPRGGPRASLGLNSAS